MKTTTSLTLSTLRKIPRNLLPVLAFAAAGAALFAPQSAKAVNTVLGYDDDANNTAGSGILVGGIPIWDTTTANWRVGGSPGALQTYDNTAASTVTALFESGTAPVGTAGTININTGTTINVNNLSFNRGNYAIYGMDSTSILNLAGTTPTINPGAQAAIIGANVQGTNITITAAASGGTTKLSLYGNNAGITGVTSLNLNGSGIIDGSANSNWGPAVTGINGATNNIFGSSTLKFVTAGVISYFDNGSTNYGNNIELNGGDATIGVMRFVGGNGGNGNTLSTFGTLTYSTANTFTTSTLTAAKGQAIAFSGISLAANGIFAGPMGAIVGTMTETGGSRSFTYTGGGIFNITGAASYTGTTTISAGGTFQLGNGSTTGSMSPTSAITLSVSNGTLMVNRSNPVAQGTDFSNSLSGAGGFTQAGSGTTTLSAANAYTGTTTVAQGNLVITGSLNGITGTALTFNSTNYAVGAAGTANFSEAAGTSQGMGTLSFLSGEGTVQSTYAGSGNSTVTFTSLAARTTGATGNFVVSGGSNGTTNKIVLTGVPTNALINQGTFFAGSSYAFNDTTGYVRAIDYTADATAQTSAGAASLSSASGANAQITGDITAQTTDAFTTLNISGNHNLTLDVAQTLTVNGILQSGNTAGGSTISGGTALQAASNAELVIRTDQVNDALTISTPIIFNGTNALTKSGAGILTLSGANTYTGPTKVNAGILKAGVVSVGGTSGAFGNSSAITLANVAGAGLDITGFNTQIGSLNGGGDAGGNVNLGAATLTLSGGGGYAGVISGAGAVTVTGGALVLSGANTYIGTTTISGGTLQLGNMSGVLTLIGRDRGLTGSLSTSSTIVNNGTLQFLRSNAVTQGVDFSASPIAGSGNLVQNGTGLLTLIGANTYAGNTSVSAGCSLQLGDGTSSANDGTLSSAIITLGTTGSTLIFNILGNRNYSGTITGGGTLFASSTLIKNGSGTQTLSGQNSSTFVIDLNAGTLAAGTTGNATTGAFGKNSLITIANTAGTTLNIAGFNNQVGSLVGGGTTGGNITLGSAVLTIGGDAGIPLGATSTGMDLYAGVISGSGSIIKIGSGWQTFAGANTYSGSTAIQAGTLAASSLNSVNGGTPLLASSSFGAPTTAATGTIDIGSTTLSAALVYTGSVNETTDRVINLAGSTGGATIEQAGSAALKFASDFTANGVGIKTLTLQGSTAGTGEIAGKIIDSSSGLTNLIKTGSGSWILSGASTFTGNTTINAGNLSVTSLNSVNGGVPLLIGSSLGAPITLATGTIAIGSGVVPATLTYLGAGESTDRVINLAGTTGGAILDQSGTGLLNFISNMTATGVGTKTLTLQGSTAGTGKITGNVVGNSPTLKTNILKTGTGTWTLAGTNTNIGTTIINNGTLQFAQQLSLYNNTPASWTAANITVANAATLALNVGGAGEFTALNIDTLKLIGTATTGFTNGSILGLDTTNATSTFSYATVIANTNTNANAITIKKLGVGVLELTAPNTYSGGTLVTAGTLLADNTTGSATGTAAVTLNSGTLGGSGTLTGSVVAGTGAHTILPSATLTGTSTAKLTMGGLTTNGNTTLAFKLVTRGTYDLTIPATPVLTVPSVNDSLNITAPTGLALGGGTLSIVNDPANVGPNSLGYYRAMQYNGSFTGIYNSTSILIPAVNPANKITYTLDIARDPGYIDIHRGFQGDANDDGTVTFADFVDLSNNFGLADKGWFGGDFNGDGVTNFADFVLLSNNFGLTVGGSSLLSSDEIAVFHAETANFGATSVPEPTSLALLGLGAAALLTRKRKA